jgi:hypothetical protein
MFGSPAPLRSGLKVGSVARLGEERNRQPRQRQDRDERDEYHGDEDHVRRE